MKSEFNKGETPEVYESPEILYEDIMMQGFLCASPTDDHGSYINDAKQEDEDIFETTLQL